MSKIDVSMAAEPPADGLEDLSEQVARVQTENARLRTLLGLDDRSAEGHEVAWSPSLLMDVAVRCDPMGEHLDGNDGLVPGQTRCVVPVPELLVVVRRFVDANRRVLRRPSVSATRKETPMTQLQELRRGRMRLWPAQRQVDRSFAPPLGPWARKPSTSDMKEESR